MNVQGLLAGLLPAILAGAIVPASASSLSGAVAWLNSPPLALSQLRGKVVLVDFWTYTCVNWRRTLPYVRAWAEKYKADGLVVIGVHTPEFSFEKKPENVRWAVAQMEVDYPVALDSNYAIWNAFNNEYWPALYFIDAQGRIRSHQFGEGGYAEAERTIQQLLTEAGNAKFDRTLVSVRPRGLEVAAGWDDVRSPETYVGHERGDPHVYSSPIQLELNNWALYGNWSVGNEAAALNQAGGKIAYRFHARDVNLVMGPERPGKTIRFRVLLDGRAPGDDRGEDIDSDGYGTVERQNTYQLIRQRRPIDDRVFTIEFFEPGVEAFDFTFG
jgi:thiol-disulfide isomerase/thioredoxin